MIDLFDETVMPLADAAAKLPVCRNGKPPHYYTVSRWATRGLHGIKLETIVIGATTCTSLEALARFARRCTNPSVQPVNTKSRRKAIDRAERELASAGI